MTLENIMSIISIPRNGILSIQKAANLLISDLQDHGFTLIWPASFTPTTYHAVLEASASVDALAVGNSNNNILPQTWRININANYSNAGTSTEAINASMRIFMGTPSQILSDGTVTDEFVGSSTVTAPAGRGTPVGGGTPTTVTTTRKSGELSAGSFYPSGSEPYAGQSIPFFCYDGIDPAKVFSNTATDVNAHPLSSHLIISNHGICYTAWVEGQDRFGNKFSWFVVQRLVSNVTGLPKIDSGKCPVFCLFSIGGGDPENPVIAPAATFANSGLASKMPNIFKMIVRETDVNRPSVPVNACFPTPDNAAVINAHQQVSIYEDQTFSLSIPSNFNTARYRYTGEMDLMLYTSADTIAAYNNVDLTMFGKTRTYTSMQANLPDNSGMRILFLTKEV